MSFFLYLRIGFATKIASSVIKRRQSHVQSEDPSTKNNDISHGLFCIFIYIVFFLFLFIFSGQMKR